MRNVAGIALLVAGAMGLLLPVVPGVPLMMAGVAVLGREHAIVRAGRAWLERWGISL